MSLFKDVDEINKRRNTLKENLSRIDFSNLYENAEETLGKAFAKLRNDKNLDKRELESVIGYLLLLDNDVREAIGVNQSKFRTLAKPNEDEKRDVVSFLSKLINHPSFHNEVERLQTLAIEDPENFTNVIGKGRIAYARA